jgi:hypothetical protein
LTHGQPAVKRDWALAIIHGCGPIGGQALAHLLREHRLDTEQSHELERIVTGATKLTDRAIYEAAIAVAQDRTAGVVGRVQALRTLYNQLTPGSFAPYESFVTDSLLPFGVSTFVGGVGVPLPDDVCEKTIAAMEEILGAASAPEPVRNAALIIAGTAESLLRRRE